MKNVATYYIHFKKDDNRLIVENEDFDEKINSLIRNEVDVEFVLIDNYGVSYANRNAAARRYYKECLDNSGKRLNPYPQGRKEVYVHFAELFRVFLHQLIIGEHEGYDFEVFQGLSRNCFVAVIPEKYCPKEKFDDFLALGPDDLFAAFPPEVIITYILPRFYLNLYKMGLIDDFESDDTDILKYRTGLK